MAINKLKKVTQSKFVRNVAIVVTGTAGAQAITMLSSPFITRLYGPEAFGVLGTFTAILTVLMPLAALSYPIAIVLPKRDADAIGLAKLSMSIALATSLLAAVILLLFKIPIVNIFNLQAVEPFVLLLPLAMFFSAAMAVMNEWVIRKKLYRIKAKIAVLQALWLNSAQAGLGLFSPVAAVLVILATLGSGLHALMLWAGVRKNTEGKMIRPRRAIGSAASSKELAWRHRDFACYRTPQVVLNAASISLPVVMLASFFGPAAAGFYSLGRLVLAAPTALIGQSVAAVFYPRINEAIHNGENAYKLLVKATFALAVVGLFPFGLVVAFGPWLFSFVFGSEWQTAGAYAQWLALWSYFTFMSRPVIATVPVLALQGFFLVYEIVSVLLRVAALGLGFFVYDTAVAAIVIFSLVSVALYVFLIAATVLFTRERTIILQTKVPLPPPVCHDARDKS